MAGAVCEDDVGRILVAVDPGSSNFAVVARNLDTGRIYLAQTFFIANCTASQHVLVIRAIDTLCSCIALLPRAPIAIVVEQQMSQRMCAISSAVLSYAHISRIPAELVGACQWKVATQTLITGKHKTNKLSALERCKELGVDCPDSHTADAWLMTEWWRVSKAMQH